MTTILELEPSDRKNLREFLIEHFSLSELEDLAFDLGIDYETLPHETKDKLAREFIIYFGHREQLITLVIEIKKRRPSDDLEPLLFKLRSRNEQSNPKTVCQQKESLNNDPLDITSHEAEAMLKSVLQNDIWVAD